MNMAWLFNPGSCQSMPTGSIRRGFSANHPPWENNRIEKKVSKSSDFKCKSTKEEAVLNKNRLKPYLLKAEIVATTQGRVQSGDSCSFGVHNGASGRDNSWHAGRVVSEAFVSRHQNGSRGQDNVRTLCKEGRLKDALRALDAMDQRGIRASLDTYVSLLQECIRMRSLAEGQQVHAHIMKSGLMPSIFVGNTLINMYIKCGSMADASKVFYRMPKRDVVSWTAMIAGYARDGCGAEALKLYWQMQEGSVEPNHVTFVSILKACTTLAALEQIHSHIIRSGFEAHVFVASTLIDRYAKCGSLEHARKVFNKMPQQDVVSWTAMVSGYAEHGHSEEALKLFWQMLHESVQPDRVTFVSILKACASPEALEWGKQIHASIAKTGFESDVSVGNALVGMYTKCGSIEHARQVFDKMPKRDVISWNAMIAGYTHLGYGDEALNIFRQMRLESVKPDWITFVSVLKACVGLAALDQGKQIHADILKSRLKSDVFVGSALIDMYAKCGSMQHARQVFDELPERDVVTWTTMVTAYAQHGYGEEVLKLFEQMQQESVKPDRITFVSILKVFSNLECLEYGKQIHAHINKSGFELDVSLGNMLVDMYAKCGSIEHARQVFDKMPERDVVSWNVLIARYIQHGNSEEVLKLFWQMLEDSVNPDRVTFIGVLKACATLAALEQGKQIHAQIVKSGLESDSFVGSALLDMYAKCGSIEHAWQVFDKMPERDVVSWNAMAAGYAQNGHGEEALKLIERMRRESVEFNHITLVCALSACSRAGLVDEGHHYFQSMNQDHGITPAAEHYACMVDLLGRAGHMEEAEDFIKIMPFQPSVMVWGALLGACRIHGHVRLARHSSECILELEPQNAGAFVALSNINAAACRWDDKAGVRKMMENRGVKKQPGHTWIEANSRLHSFVVEDISHPQTEEIHAELNRLSGLMVEAEYVPDPRFVLHALEDDEKESSFVSPQ